MYNFTVCFCFGVFSKISSAACGYGFTLLSSSTTDIIKVWGMGLNKDSQLGFQRSRRDRSKDWGVLKTYRAKFPLLGNFALGGVENI